ncbi:MAG: hypothetical protein ACREQ5_15775 [Candidatus Dormibacteria bacterium]
MSKKYTVSKLLKERRVLRQQLLEVNKELLIIKKDTNLLQITVQALRTIATTTIVANMGVFTTEANFLQTIAKITLNKILTVEN